MKGRVSSIFKGKGFGFIEGEDNNIYFMDVSRGKGIFRVGDHVVFDVSLRAKRVKIDEEKQ